MTPENAVKKAVMDLLAAERIFSFRLNTATMLSGKRMFSCHSLGKGAADIFALPLGSAIGGIQIVPLWIETKAGANGQSEEQKSFQRHVESLGHRYIVARSSDDVLQILKEIKQ
jgi:hypothetical protein